MNKSSHQSTASDLGENSVDLWWDTSLDVTPQTSKAKKCFQSTEEKVEEIAPIDCPFCALCAFCGQRFVFSTDPSLVCFPFSVLWIWKYKPFLPQKAQRAQKSTTLTRHYCWHLYRGTISADIFPVASLRSATGYMLRHLRCQNAKVSEQNSGDQMF